MTAVLSPIDLGNATKVGGRIWRKQLLPVGSINYKGRTIEFTPEKLRAMEQAFRDRAFDAVPLVFADGENRHTMDPRAATGEVVDLEFTGDGLDMFVRPSPEADELLSRFPNVGVSARIFENYERADGKSYPAAIQHALITWDPRIPGMRPWEAVNLSNHDTDVLDLSGEQYNQEEPMAAQPLTDEELEALRALLGNGSTTDEDTNAGTSPAADEDEFDLSDEELERIAAEALAEGTDDAPSGTTQGEKPAGATGGEPTEEGAQPEGDKQLVAAANDTAAVELANQRAAELAEQVAQMQKQLDARNFEAERDKLAGLGIPPAVTNLARPLLEGQQVIELSNGEQVDAGKVMRDVLTAFSEQVKLLDLSGETGSAFDPDQDKAAEEDRKRWVAQARTELDLD